MQAIGLRFFTVYGPWGRPDMAAYFFADAIVAGRPIEVFNEGRMARDFTYIDDIVAGTLAALDHPPTDDPPHGSIISAITGRRSCSASSRCWSRRWAGPRKSR